MTKSATDGEMEKDIVECEGQLLKGKRRKPDKLEMKWREGEGKGKILQGSGNG